MLKRIYNLSRGALYRVMAMMEKRSPESLLEIEKENLRKQIVNYNQGLALHASLCERLIVQVRKLENEERDLRVRTAAHLQAGNRDAAGEYAIRLETVRREVSGNRGQLVQAEQTYQELVHSRDVTVRAAQEKLLALKNGISDLRIKRATAELSEMASGAVSQLGGTSDTLDRLTDMVEEQRELAAGRVRVARDSFSTEAIAVHDIERRALAQQALEDFAARESLPLGAAAIGTTPGRQRLDDNQAV